MYGTYLNLFSYHSDFFRYFNVMIFSLKSGKITWKCVKDWIFLNFVLFITLHSQRWYWIRVLHKSPDRIQSFHIFRWIFSLFQVKNYSRVMFSDRRDRVVVGRIPRTVQILYGSVLPAHISLLPTQETGSLIHSFIVWAVTWNCTK